MAPAPPDTTPAVLPGWNASLELGYEVQGGRTRPAHRRHCGPLRVLRHENDPAGALTHVIVHPPGGVAGGDSLAVDLALAAHSEVLVTSVGAGKWYRGFGRDAHQRIEARVAHGARLAWLPLENILYCGARASMDARFVLQGDATLLYGDVVCFGRPAADERFTEGFWRQRTEMERDGRLLWCERALVHADGAGLHAPAGLAGHCVAGTLVYAGPPLPEALHERARALTVEGRSGVAQLPDVWLARFVGDSAQAAQQWLRALRTLISPHTHGRVVADPRIWST